MQPLNGRMFAAVRPQMSAPIAPVGCNDFRVLAPMTSGPGPIAAPGPGLRVRRVRFLH